MKYLLALIAAVILGVVLYRGIDISRTPAAAGTTAPQPPASPPDTSSPPAISESSESSESPRAVAAMTPPPALPMATAPSPVPGQRSPGLLIPVQGKTASDLADTFTDARSEGRSHDAIDIMASAGTPVLAVADGHVEKLFHSERGGLTIYQFEPQGKYAYYYAHLQGYAPGLAEKQSLKRGQVIGYVGSTGNASPDAPHLHFAVFLLGAERRWWEGTAINPYPMLASPGG
jgi:murein DD-endopeptidase MepM/ murein hydrolase activator NlpD